MPANRRADEREDTEQRPDRNDRPDELREYAQQRRQKPRHELGDDHEAGAGRDELQVIPAERLDERGDLGRTECGREIERQRHDRGGRGKDEHERHRERDSDQAVDRRHAGG